MQRFALETPRLRLAPMSPRFLEACLAKNRDAAELELALGVAPEWFHEESLISLRARQMRDEPDLAGWLVHAIVRKDGSRMIGHFNFHGPPGAEYLRPWSPRAIELGYTIYPAYRGSGFATELVSGVVESLRKDRIADDVILSIGPDNAPSIRIAGNLGFVRVGEVPDGDRVEWVYKLSL